MAKKEVCGMEGSNRRVRKQEEKKRSLSAQPASQAQTHTQSTLN